MPGKHARLSPSGADRWMTCPGSVALCDALPATSSPDADEGTAAHFLASEALSTGQHPAYFIGRKIAVTPDGAIWAGEEEQAVFADCLFTVDAAMASPVNVYVQAVLAEVKDAQFVGFEQRLPLYGVTADDPDDEGMSDTVIITADGELQIHDGKFGYRRVAVVGNRQERIYALAALDAYDMLYDIKRVKLFIHMPRVPGASGSWEVSLEELAAFREEVLLAAKAVDADDAPLVPSDDACRYCRAKEAGCCPALDAKVAEEVGLDFNDLTAGPLVDVAIYDEAALAKKLNACDLVEQWLKATRARGLELANQGIELPGWKLVAGRAGNREWKDEAQAETELKGMRLKADEMYDRKVISPTAAEGIFGPKGTAPSPKRWAKLEALIMRKDGKPTLAPASDKRPALEVSRADDFDNLDDGESLI